MKKILFVCMGNICRSPAAEGIMKKLIFQNGLNKELLVNSAGTIGYHEGELPDIRMSALAKERGYILDSRSRKFDPLFDFDEYDYIVTMDDNNYADITRFDKNELYKNKIFKMVDFISDTNIAEVPDPYYGSDDEFKYVIDLLENGSQNLLNKIKADIERSNKK